LVSSPVLRRWLQLEFERTVESQLLAHHPITAAATVIKTEVRNQFRVCEKVPNSTLIFVMPNVRSVFQLIGNRGTS
jgi:hypothetical protein